MNKETRFKFDPTKIVLMHAGCGGERSIQIKNEGKRKRDIRYCAYSTGFDSCDSLEFAKEQNGTIFRHFVS